MQCAKCQTTLEPAESGAAPTSCPHCGARPPAACGAPSRQPRLAARRGAAAWIAIVVLLLVGLAAASVVSTIYAINSVKQRDQARDDFAQGSAAIDEMVVNVGESGKLKGTGAAEDRTKILQPAADYYKHVVDKYRGDEQMLPEVASAQFHLAAVQVKLGQPECVATLMAGLKSLNAMVKGDFAEDTYPRFQDSVMRIAAPTEWFTLKTPDQQSHAISLYLAMQSATTNYRDLTRKFPKNVAFRGELSALLKSLGQLLSAIGRSGPALDSWVEASSVLESIVRDEPSNSEYQARLAESLANMARLQQSLDQTDKAVDNYKRAVEVRTKLAEAHPDDKALAQGVEQAKRDLARVEKAQAAKKDAPKAAASKEETPPTDAPKVAASEKDASPGEAPKEDAATDAPKDEAPKK